MSFVPKYVRIYNTLKSEIINNENIVGEMLPPEPDLCKRFGVSRITIRNAVRLLSENGYVSVRQGIGTKIIYNSVRQDFNGITSVTETFRRQGYDVKTENLVINTITASARLVNDFQITVGSSLLRIQRVQVANGKPVAIMINYLLPRLVENIELYIDGFTSMYELLEKKYNVSIDSTDDEISARNADSEQARLLGINENDALLRIRRICYSNGSPVAVDDVHVVSNAYRIKLNLHGRSVL